MAPDLVKVLTAPNLAIAEMVREVLENEGIPAFVRPPRLSPYIGVDEADVLVSPAQADEARRIIELQLRQDNTPEGSPEGQ